MYIYFAGCILLIVVLVVLIRFMIKASKASPAIYAQYQGVFGKGTAWVLLLFGVSPLIQGAAMFVFGLFGLLFSETRTEAMGAVLFGLVELSASLLISFFVIRGAKSRCPEELKAGLNGAIFIATVGVLGTYCRYCWNAMCGIMSIIPGFGWMTNFIITKDTSAKKDLVKAGEQWDTEYAKQVEQEKKEEERKREEEKRKREEMENDVRKKVWKEENRTDIVFNSDSSLWRYSDEDVWRKTEKKL